MVQQWREDIIIDSRDTKSVSWFVKWHQKHCSACIKMQAIIPLNFDNRCLAHKCFYYIAHTSPCSITNLMELPKYSYSWTCTGQLFLDKCHGWSKMASEGTHWRCQCSSMCQWESKENLSSVQNHMDSEQEEKCSDIPHSSAKLNKSCQLSLLNTSVTQSILCLIFLMYVRTI